ncbi:PQQ-binding-like beta-propeller repeat protein [Haloterrigena salifodinae]|uniref:PQQ-binding-like beta-propeller repeat protein n=1 Tax=Haloterrigena salifodinae TaxID=2675099 RepID=UPI001E3BAEAC|nr:PQQ-binding-like beta-propeller repeat protein [Haloterrigena salifodinae]
MKFKVEQISGGRSRRALLSAAGVALTTGLTGCLGALEGDEDETENVSGGDGDTESDEESTDSSDETAELRETLAAADPYRMLQYGPDHVGNTVDAGPTADVDAVWTFREGADDSHYEIGTPAIVDGTVYVPENHSVGDDSAETVVYALDGATGDIEWEWSYPRGTTFGSTVVAEGAVVLIFGGSVVALEADAGTERWRLERDFSDAVTVADGTAYAINTTYADPPTLVAIDLETGRERWTKPLGNERMYWPTPPAVADGTVYQGGMEFTALSAADGERLWSKDFGNAVTGSPTVTDDACYVPLGDGTIAALGRDGTLRWRQPVEHGGHGSGLNSVSSPAVDDGTLYVTNSWRLTALDADDGAQHWTTETAGDRPPVVADGVVYVSGLNAMGAHDGATGDCLWRYETDASSSSGNKVAPVVGETAFFPSAGLQALREADATSD